MAVDLTLFGRPVGTVFDLLGDKENDLTYALGWGLARNEPLARRLLAEVFPNEEIGELRAVRLQEFEPGGGFTDIEVESEHVAMVLEAKRGWDLPTLTQLTKYTPRLDQAAIGRILVVSGASPEFAAPSVPAVVAGIPVVYRSWREIVILAESCASQGRHAERRLLKELIAYLRGLMTMQKQTPNMVYVVSLGAERTGWSGSLTPIEIVTTKDRYFHPIGDGYPKEPPNYVGFRWAGKLQLIRHVDAYEVFTNPHEHIPEIPPQEWKRHFVYTLGPSIVPAQEVRTGNLFRAARVEAALDLLLTCDTIAEARDRTRERLQAAGEG
ncbi:MAG: hypothetical protein MSC30_17095 [Gaiellaceae bacterium MAG52_C11]|nr:hypothetical protein [Candidatus Gaiellasilicea maunaloa]